MYQDEDADLYYGATQRHYSYQPRYRAASRSHHPRPYQNGPPPLAIRYPYYESNHYAYHRPPKSQPPPQRWARPRYPRPSSFMRPPWINHSAYESSERWRQQNYKSFSTHETKSQNNFVDDSKRKENSSDMAVSTNKNINNDICNSDPKCKENGATSCKSGNSSSSKSDGKSELREKVSKATTNESVNSFSKSDRKPECEEVTLNESLNSSTKSAGKLECKESVSTPTSNKSDNSSTKNDEKSAPKVKTLKATSSKSVSLSTKRDGKSKCRKKTSIETSRKNNFNEISTHQPSQNMVKCSMHLNTSCVMCKENESKHAKQRADIPINKRGSAEKVTDVFERNLTETLSERSSLTKSKEKNESTNTKTEEFSTKTEEFSTKTCLIETSSEKVLFTKLKVKNESVDIKAEEFSTNTCLIDSSDEKDCLTKPKKISESALTKIVKYSRNTIETSSEKVLLTKSKENNGSAVTEVEEYSKDLSNDDHSARGPLWIKKTYSPERRTGKYEQIPQKVCVEDEKFPQNATHENLGSAMVETNDVGVSFKNENIIGIKPAFLTERSDAGKEKSWLWARKTRDNICQRKVDPSGKKSHLKSEKFSTCNNSVNDVHLKETGVEFVIENKLPKDDDQNTNIVKNECLKNEKLKADHLKSEKTKDENPTKYLKNDNLLKNIPENENLSEDTRDTKIAKSTNNETLIESSNTKETSSIKDISTDRSKSMLGANSINGFPRGIDKTNDNPTTNNEKLVVENSSVEKDTLKNVHTTLLNLSSKELAKSKTKKEKLKEAISFKISQIGNKFTDTMRSTQLKNTLKKSQSVKNIQESTNKLVTEGSGLQSQPSNVDQENSYETHTEVGTPTKPHPAKKTFELPSDVEASNLFCPECRRVQSTNIIDHLQTKHNYNQRAALFEYAKQKAIQVCTTEHGNDADHIPLPCYECSSWFCDIKSHMKSQHGGNVEFDIEELNRLKTKHWHGADSLTACLQNVHDQLTLFRCCECLDEVNETEFKDHLRKQHDYEYDEAALEHSKQFCIHTCLTKHKGYHQPLPCRKCNKWTCRLDKHMLRNHSCFIYKQRIAALDKGRILHWKNKKLMIKDIVFPTHPSITSINPDGWPCYENMKFCCPHCHDKVLDLVKHLISMHGYFDSGVAKFEHSKQLCIHICKTLHDGKHLILPCEECNEWSCRLDLHLKADHGNEGLEDRARIIDKMKESYGDSINDHGTNCPERELLPAGREHNLNIIYPAHPGATTIYPKIWTEYYNTELVCPECSENVNHLAKHLCGKHDYIMKNAHFEHSKSLCIHICETTHEEKHTPLPCSNCNEWTCKLDAHLKIEHGETDEDYIKNLMTHLRLVYWEGENRSSSIERTEKQFQTDFPETKNFNSKFEVNQLNKLNVVNNDSQSTCKQIESKENTDNVIKMCKSKLKALSEEIHKQKRQAQELELEALLQRGKQKHRSLLTEIVECKQTSIITPEQSCLTKEDFSSSIRSEPDCCVVEKAPTMIRLKSCLKKELSVISCLDRSISFNNLVEVTTISNSNKETILLHQEDKDLEEDSNEIYLKEPSFDRQSPYKGLKKLSQIISPGNVTELYTFSELDESNSSVEIVSEKHNQLESTNKSENSNQVTGCFENPSETSKGPDSSSELLDIDTERSGDKVTNDKPNEVSLDIDDFLVGLGPLVDYDSVVSDNSIDQSDEEKERQVKLGRMKKNTSDVNKPTVKSEDPSCGVQSKRNVVKRKSVRIDDKENKHPESDNESNTHKRLVENKSVGVHLRANSKRNKAKRKSMNGVINKENKTPDSEQSEVDNDIKMCSDFQIDSPPSSYVMKIHKTNHVKRPRRLATSKESISGRLSTSTDTKRSIRSFNPVKRSLTDTSSPVKRFTKIKLKKKTQNDNLESDTGKIEETVQYRPPPRPQRRSKRAVCKDADFSSDDDFHHRKTAVRVCRRDDFDSASNSEPSPINNLRASIKIGDSHYQRSLVNRSREHKKPIKIHKCDKNTMVEKTNDQKNIAPGTSSFSSDLSSLDENDIKNLHARKVYAPRKRVNGDSKCSTSKTSRKKQRGLSMMEEFEQDIATISTVAKLFIRQAPQHEERLKKICKDVLSEFSKPIKESRSL